MKTAIATFDSANRCFILYHLEKILHTYCPYCIFAGQPVSGIITVNKKPAAKDLRPALLSIQTEGYTSPEKPMKAMARIPAVIKAMGVPRNATGTSSISSRSRIPAKSTSAKAKPRAVETE